MLLCKKHYPDMSLVFKKKNKRLIVLDNSNVHLHSVQLSLVLATCFHKVNQI